MFQIYRKAQGPLLVQQAKQKTHPLTISSPNRKRLMVKINQSECALRLFVYLLLLDGSTIYSCIVPHLSSSFLVVSTSMAAFNLQIQDLDDL